MEVKIKTKDDCQLSLKQNITDQCTNNYSYNESRTMLNMISSSNKNKREMKK